MFDLDADDLRKLLLVRRGAHRFCAAAIDDGDVLGAELLRLHGDVDRGVATADDDDAAPDRQRGQILGLPQRGDVVDRIMHALQRLAVAAERVHPCKPYAEEDGVEALAERREGDVAAERLRARP